MPGDINLAKRPEQVLYENQLEIEKQNAELFYQNMILESETANLWYELMKIGDV